MAHGQLTLELVAEFENRMQQLVVLANQADRYFDVVPHAAGMKFLIGVIQSRTLSYVHAANRLPAEEALHRGLPQWQSVFDRLPAKIQKLDRVQELRQALRETSTKLATHGLGQEQLDLRSVPPAVTQGTLALS